VDQGCNLDQIGLHSVHESIALDEDLTDVVLTKLRDDPSALCERRERAAGIPELSDKG